MTKGVTLSPPETNPKVEVSFAPGTAFSDQFCFAVHSFRFPPDPVPIQLFVAACRTELEENAKMTSGKNFFRQPVNKIVNNFWFKFIEYFGLPFSIKNAPRQFLAILRPQSNRKKVGV